MLVAVPFKTKIESLLFMAVIDVICLLIVEPSVEYDPNESIVLCSRLSEIEL